MALRTLLLAASAAAVLAACPNMCSGHGSCGKNDKCSCYKMTGSYSPHRQGWTGADCSQRTCPLGRAYDQISTARPALEAVQFESGSGVSKPKLSAFFVASSQDAAYRAARSDRHFYVKIMSVSGTTAPYATFAWRVAGDEFFSAEEGVGEYMSTARAFELQSTALGRSGVFVYWDAVKDDTPSFVTDATQLAVGDVYDFVLGFNEGEAFDAGDANTAHQLVECSGRGTCDGAKGTCKCDEGYGGDACQRVVCPNKCNGHGTCVTQLRFASDGDAANVNAYKGAYDADQQYGCKCDPGYRGAACEKIECPSGPDPMGADGGAEGMDCSGRGVCDYSKGVCSCNKGFFGERCESQTTLQ